MRPRFPGAFQAAEIKTQRTGGILMVSSIKQQLIGHMSISGDSQTKLAKLLGVSTAALNQYLNDKYPNPESIESKAQEFFSLQDLAVAVTKAPDYVPTSISQQVYNVISYCHINRCIGSIIGDAGIGKTKGARKYAEDYSETITITATKACKSLKAIYRKIARKLRLSENMNIADMESDIRVKLDGSNKILIIDEAQHLSLGAIDGLRSLNDENDETNLPPIGIVLIGNYELVSKMRGRLEESYSQLRNRIQITRIVSTSDVQEDDIKKLFPVFPEKSPEIKFLYKIAQSKWGIRGATKIFINASNAADISLKGLESMSRFMGIGLAN
jgi:hypothetical protein